MKENYETIIHYLDNYGYFNINARIISFSVKVVKAQDFPTLLGVDLQSKLYIAKTDSPTR